mgnify:CR=1 FL=1
MGKKKMTPALAALAAATMLAALPAAAQATIVPGKSVKGVSLGDATTKVRQVLGKPEAGSNMLNYRYIRRHGLGVYFVAGKALEIMVTRAPQATRSGIRVGSSRTALTKAYPRAKCLPAVVGKNTFECRLPSRFKGRATETVFTTKRDKVASIVVRFK